MAQKRKPVDEPQLLSRPATTQEAREAELVALAFDEVEMRLRNHTATGQEITAIIRLGSEKARLEREKLAHETEVLKSKKELLDSSKKSEELYTKAMTAMRSYVGLGAIEDDPYILGID